MLSNLLFLRKPTNYDYIRHQRLYTARHRPLTNAEHGKMLGAIRGILWNGSDLCTKKVTTKYWLVLYNPGLLLRRFGPPSKYWCLRRTLHLTQGGNKGCKTKSQPYKGRLGPLRTQIRVQKRLVVWNRYRPKGQEIKRRKGQTTGLDKGRYRVIGLLYSSIKGEMQEED